jgi:hypothetical protein
VTKCQELKIAYADAVKPDCSRLPPQYQPHCRSMNNLSPALVTAKQRCADTTTDPRQFNACVWATTKYPAYKEFDVPQMLTTRDNYAKFCRPQDLNK